MNFHPTDRPENNIIIKFIKSCLKSRWNPTALQHACSITEQAGFSWEELSEYALQESITPILYELLSNNDEMAAEKLFAFRNYYLDSAANNALLFQELKILLIKLRQVQIEVILLKGAALATQIYPNVAMRPMVDLDILVKPNDAPVLIKTLQSFGYRILRQEEKPGFTLNFENEISLYKQDSIPKIVEVHWSLFNSIYYQYKISNNWLWKSAVPVEIDSVPALMLDPIAQTLHLCGHLTIHHTGIGWLWTHDLAEVIMFYRDKMDWELLINLAQRYDLVLSLQSNLLAVKDIYGKIIPDEIIKKLNSISPSNSEYKYIQNLKSTQKTSGRTFLEDLNYLPDWRKKISFTFSSLFPTLAYMKVRYSFSNPLILPFFYVYRWYLGVTGLYTNK